MDGVLFAARKFFRLPARGDVPADSLPARLAQARDALIVEPMDWQQFQTESSQWMRYWDEHIRGRN